MQGPEISSNNSIKGRYMAGPHFLQCSCFKKHQSMTSVLLLCLNKGKASEQSLKQYILGASQERDKNWLRTIEETFQTQVVPWEFTRQICGQNCLF